MQAAGGMGRWQGGAKGRKMTGPGACGGGKWQVEHTEELVNRDVVHGAPGRSAG
jgi:hypothetical protein